MKALEKIPPTWLIAGGLVAGLAVWVAVKGARNVGASIGSGAVHLADGVLSGGVIEAGSLVGIPATNETECDRAKAEGRTLDASFACTAKDFFSYLME